MRARPTTLLMLVTVLSGTSVANADLVLTTLVDTTTEWTGLLTWADGDFDSVMPTTFANLPLGNQTFELIDTTAPLAFMTLNTGGIGGDGQGPPLAGGIHDPVVTPLQPTKIGNYQNGLAGISVDFSLTANFTANNASFRFASVPEPAAWQYMALVALLFYVASVVSKCAMRVLAQHDHVGEIPTRCL